MPTIDDYLLDETGAAILDENGVEIQTNLTGIGKVRYYFADLQDETGLDITDEDGYPIQMPNSTRQSSLWWYGSNITDALAMGVDMGATGSGGVAAVSGVGAAAAFTLEARVYPEEVLPNTYHTIAGRYSDATVVGACQPSLWLYNNLLLVGVRDNTGTYRELNQNPALYPKLGKYAFYAVAADYDGTNLRLYVNGVLVGTMALSGVEAADATLPFQVGRCKEDPINALPWQGGIEEVRWSKVARYAGTYTPSQSPFTSDANTLGLWHFDEGEGAVTYDSGPSGKHGILIGEPVGYAPWWDQGPDQFVNYEWWNGSVWVPWEVYLNVTASPITITNWPDRAETFGISLRAIDSAGGIGDYSEDLIVAPALAALTGAGAIASGQAMGTPFIVATSILLPTGIASAQAFGAIVVLNMQQYLSPGGIASAGAFGTPVIVPGSTSVLPSGIASAQAMGAVVVAPGQVLVAPGGIASAQAFGTPVLGLFTGVYPTAIASAEAFGNPTVLPGSIALLPSGIATAEAFGAITIFRTISLSPTGIASAQAFGTAVIAPGPTSVLPSGIVTAEAFGTAYIQRLVTLAVTGIASGEVVSNPLSAYDTAGRTVSAGWGTADIGGAWVGTGNAAYNVNGGKLRILSSASSRNSRLPISVLDSEVTVLVDFDLIPSPNSLDARVRTRANVALSQFYHANFTVDAASQATLEVGGRLIPAGTYTQIGNRVTVGTYVAGDQWAIKFRTRGASPTRLQAKAWKVGTPEPPQWQLDELDSLLGPQAADGVGLTVPAATLTSYPTVSFDEFKVLDLQAGPTILPTISVLPSGIATAQVVPSPIIVPGQVLLVPVGIVSGELFGLPFVLPPGISWMDEDQRYDGSLLLARSYYMVLVDTAGSIEVLNNKADLKLIDNAGWIVILSDGADLDLLEGT